MAYLIVIGAVSLLFGLVFLFTPNFLLRLGEFFNSVIVYLDEKLQPIRFLVGLGLVLVGGWLLYVAAKYPELAYLNALWIISLAFGLLFLFFARWLAWLSDVSNRVIFSTDELVIGWRKIVGAALLIAGGYIFYAAYALR